jgi:hypothetical protein
MKKPLRHGWRGRGAIPPYMRQRLQEVAIFPVLMGLLAATACTVIEMKVDSEGWTLPAPAPASDAPIIRIIGTVRYVDVEGGQYVIADIVNNTRFNPTNLPREFQEDGTDVEVEARRREGAVSTGMVGPIVDLIRIRHLPVP